MKDKLLKIFNEYKYDYYFLNFDLSLNEIVEQVEQDLINKPYSVDISRSLITQLWQLQRLMNIKNLENTKEFNTILTNISEDKNYSLSEYFILCNKFIPCEAVKTINNFYVLNDNQIQKIISLGYGINSFKIEKSKKIRNIYCLGKHPNLDLKTNSFCIGQDLFEIDVNKNNLKVVEEILSQFNLTSTYIDKNELNKILEVIE